MDECISSRTRSSLSSDSLNNWKICQDNFKIPKRTASKLSNSTKNKKEIITLINKEIDLSAKKYETSIHELNYLQSGLIFIFYKSLQPTSEIKVDPQSNKCENVYEYSRKYFIDDSDDSDPEYIDSDEIINRVNAERYILNRVDELKKNNLWSAKMLNKKPDPPKPLFHWDFLMKEIKWQQGNFSSLKQNKRIDARKLAVAASKYVKEKEAQMAKLNKEETVKAKKHCLNISKMIKEWWKQMQKIVSAKQKFRLDAKRQEAMNDHLGMVIETTQKYTEWLTEDLKMVTSGENDTSADDDPEFQVKDELTDDEETIAEDEMAMDYDVEEEINDLQLQNQKSLEDILNELPADYFKPVCEVNNNENLSVEINCDQNCTTDVKNNVIGTVDKDGNKANVGHLEQDLSDTNDNDDNDDVKLDENSEDCEDTMIEQENFEERDDEFGHGKEIDDLVNDAEIPIEELVKLYKKMHAVSDVNDNDNDDHDDGDMDDSSSQLSESDDHNSTDGENTSSSYESSVDLGVVFNIEKDDKESLEFQGQFQEITEVAMSTQPRGFTLESTDVKVQVPFLLKYSLREYQHVGLDWMAAIYEKRLNGVLADEMGLGKTIQTIALLAYLSCEKGIWGPHLVVVPTSVVLNWEIEFKKWCPGFKIITYFGSAKERKEKRKGWTKTNAFHVCITSYKLAIQDCQVFKRKKWRYIILDEAQNIKNFKSQRWQTLLTFNSQRRLLLTGTPLQNNLMELWSLMHFLMPNIFQSHREFSEWFGSPLSGMVEGSNEYNEQLVMRLHKVLRPFILRRLKKDVEKQMPQKFEHLIMCPLSKRQRFLYDDYMSLASTKEKLSSGQLMNIISILMQLRKVCNHPNLFEDRPTLSPFSMTQEEVEYNFPKMLLIDDIYDNRLTNGRPVLPAGTCGLADMALDLPKFVNERIFNLTVKANLIVEVDDISVTDWVGKFDEKFTDCPQATSFIPRDLIDYLKKSENDEEIVINLPPPLIYGLKVKKRPFNKTNNVLPDSIIGSRRRQRKDRLRAMIERNSLRCSQYSSMGPDVIDAVTIIKSPSDKSWDKMHIDFLKPRTLEQFLNEHMEIIEKVTLVIPAALSSGVRVNTSCRSLINHKSRSEVLHNQSSSSIPICLSKIRQNQLVQFPDTRLIEYDCGKLQILVTLLKKLKTEGHRCLIFTQMTRMLDVLEQFLSYHGYRYLRLDGTTKIEQRQIMMEQFNKDERIFVFILSTRSGGVGVNLTGADTVIFYDSDWNPTMDAQAQDRCHRIGQTRDVHIYRLISRMTIEENILKKANEKRHLNEMAIEGGQFNMSYFKTNTLQDIFQTPTGVDIPTVVDTEVTSTKVYKTVRGRTIQWKGDKSIFNCKNEHEKMENKVIDSDVIEAALEEVEDESDRLAAKITRAETKADLVEFDETVPWEDTEDGSTKPDNEENRFRLEMESQLENFNSQLNPLQRYGVGWIELSSENVLCTELELEETQIENNKQAWELDQIKALHEDQEQLKNIEEDDMLYIYGEYDPYAAQREELEKLRKEEEYQQLQELLKEEEIAKREKDKAAAQAWAQEQHINALKRKSEMIDDGESSSNFTNSESIVRSPKQRKTVVPRLEFPDESITTVKTINTSNADDVDQPIASSSSSSMINDRSFPSKRRRGRQQWDYPDGYSESQKNSSRVSWNNSLDYTGEFSDNSKIQTSFSPSCEMYEDDSSISARQPVNNHISRKPFPHARRMGRPPWKNIKWNDDENHISNSLTPTNNHVSHKPFPHARRMGRPPWKNIKRTDDDDYKPGSPVKKSFPISRRYNKQSHQNLPMSSDRLENRSLVQRKLSFPLSRQISKLSSNESEMENNSVSEMRLSYPLSKRPGKMSEHNISSNHFHGSPDENIAPFSNEIFHLSNSFKQISKPYEKFQMPNGYHDIQDDFIKDPIKMENIIKSTNDDFITSKKKRGRPSIAEMNRRTNLFNPRHRNCSESTNASAILNKKNSFKIPVKTLNGEHKLFSAPLLLLKAKPVFVVTRKIEDNHGNIYTQNLTYPIDCNENFNAIADKLSSFASNVAGK